jgi:hypothetical protein
MLAGGSRRVGEQLGVTEAIGVTRLYAALRQDCDWVRDAATPQQQAELAGIDPTKRQTDATWVGSPEVTEQDRAERRQALDRHVREWGREPE